MTENFEVSCIFFCSCFLENVIKRFENEKIKNANDMMFLVSGVTGTVLVEYFNKNCFVCFFCIKHLPEMFYLKTGVCCLHYQRKIFFRLVRSNHRIIFVINTRGVAKIQINPFKISSKTLTMTSSLWRWSHYRDVRESMKNFKYCAISLNILHTSGLCGILRFTAPLILISKKFQSKYIHTVSSALCAPIVRAAIKRLLLGAWQTCELPKNLIRPPG